MIRFHGLAMLSVLFVSACGPGPTDSRLRDLDVAGELLPIQNQFNTGFCQSYAMAGYLEHLWWRKTGTPLKLSEKFIAKAALRRVADAYWNKQTDTFDEVRWGFHIGNFGMTDLFTGAAYDGIVPDSAMPTARTIDGKLEFALDHDLYRAFVDRTSAEMNEAGLSRDAFISRVEELFGDPSPFELTARGLSYETFSEQTVTIRSATELRDFLEFDADDQRLVYNRDAFPTGMNFFNPETRAFLLESEERFLRRPLEGSAREISTTVQQLLDEGIPVVFWNKWQKMVDGAVQDTGGHVTVVVGYQRLADGTTWFRVKNSGGVNEGVHERPWPGSTHPVRTVSGYSYFEREVFEKALVGVFVPTLAGQAFSPAE